MRANEMQKWSLEMLEDESPVFETTSECNFESFVHEIMAALDSNLL